MTVDKFIDSVGLICDQYVEEFAILEDNRTDTRKLKFIVIAVSVAAVIVILVINPWLRNTTIDPTNESTIQSDVLNNKTVNIVSTFEKTCTDEFAADMHRPEGYDRHIGSVLAIKMSMTTNDEQLFRVILMPINKEPLTKNIDEVNQHIDDKISLSDVYPVKIDNTNTTIERYYSVLNTKQILALASEGTMCLYLGSGKGEYSDISWETTEGINVYCELFGDMYVLGENKDIECFPDLFCE